MERVYLDTCVWCRPFDKLTPRITREGKALHEILSLADKAKIEIVGSDIVLFEASHIDVHEKRDTVFALIHKSVTIIAKPTKSIKKLAEELMERCNLDDMDAAHIATAIDCNSDTFITTDDGILNKKDCILKLGIIVKNPENYVMETQND